MKCSFTIFSILKKNGLSFLASLFLQTKSLSTLWPLLPLTSHTLTFTAFVFPHFDLHCLYTISLYSFFDFTAFSFTQLAFIHFGLHCLCLSIISFYSFLDFNAFVFPHFDLHCLCLYTINLWSSAITRFDLHCLSLYPISLFSFLPFTHFYHLLIFRLYYLCHYTISLYPLWSSLPLHLHKNLLIYFTFITEIHWLLFGLYMNQTTIPFIPKTFLSLLIILLSSFKTKKKPFLFSQTKKFKLGTCSWL